MKIEKVCTETYIFEKGDMFIFQKDSGCYDKGDFIILKEEEPGRSWKLHSNRTLLCIVNNAWWSEAGLTELIKIGTIVHVGIVQAQVEDSIK